MPLNYNYPHISSCWIFSHFLSLPPNFLLATFPFTHKLFRTDEWNRECLDVDCSFLVYHNNPISISRNMDYFVSFYINHDIISFYLIPKNIMHDIKAKKHFKIYISYPQTMICSKYHQDLSMKWGKLEYGWNPYISILFVMWECAYVCVKYFTIRI